MAPLAVVCFLPTSTHIHSHPSTPFVNTPAATVPLTCPFPPPPTPPRTHHLAVEDADLTLDWSGLEVHVDVTDADRFSQETFLGHVVLPLSRVPRGAPRAEWLPLARRTSRDKVGVSAGEWEGEWMVWYVGGG